MSVASRMLACMTTDVEPRARQLLAQMTLEEKVAQLTSLWLHLEPGSGDFAPGYNERKRALEGPQRR